VHIEPAIQLDICEQIHPEYRIYHNEKEEEAAHVDEGRHGHQEGHYCRPQCVVARDEKEEAHDSQGFYDRYLGAQLEGT
jgi:hypothetical protein